MKKYSANYSQTNHNFVIQNLDDKVVEDDYQIILSTHDEFIARYMSYKFEKFKMSTSIQNVQDLVLEQTLK